MFRGSNFPKVAHVTSAAVFQTGMQDSAQAGAELGRAIREHFKGHSPDVVILFASPVYAFDVLLEALHAACSPGAVVGCSSAGEFTHEGISASSAVVLALYSENMRFDVHVGRQLRADPYRAAAALAATFHPDADPEFPFLTTLLLIDALAGFGEEFLGAFTAATSGRYQIIGGGAADDATFQNTYVFAGTKALSDAAVALEIRSRHPVGIGTSHGWTPASHSMTVTAASGLRLSGLDGIPAAHAVESFAVEQGLVFDRDAPLPFFLHHVLGIVTPDGYKLRVPLQIAADGALLCAAEVPVGATVRVMRTSDASAADAAAVAARRARFRLQGAEPGVAIFFDCAATRLRLGEGFEASVNEIVSGLEDVPCIGCNTYGQFARVDGQFSGFHNCTAVVCVFPR